MAQCILADSGFPSSMWRELFMVAAYLRNRTPHKALKMETLFGMLDGDKPTSRAFAPSEPEPSCTPRTPESSTPRPGKGSCLAIARRANLTESGTQRLAASWRAGTSSSSRHRRTCFPRLHKSLRCKICCRHRGISATTLWTMTSPRTTTYCGMQGTTPMF